MTRFLKLNKQKGFGSVQVTKDDPRWFLTGVTDTDGNLTISLPKDASPRFLYQYSSVNKGLIDHLQNTYDPGRVYTRITQQTRVETRSERGFKPGLRRTEYTLVWGTQEGIRDFIIPHFEKYPLQTYKAVDFLIFKEAFNIYKSTSVTGVKTSEKTLVLVAFCAYASNTGGKQRKPPTFEEYCNEKNIDISKYQEEINSLNSYIDQLKINYQDFYEQLGNDGDALTLKPVYSYFAGFTQGDGGLSASVGDRLRWEMNINDREPFVIRRCVATLGSNAVTKPKKGQNSWVVNIMFSEKRLSFLFSDIFQNTTWVGDKTVVLELAKEYLGIMSSTRERSLERNVAIEALKAKIKAYRAS